MIDESPPPVSESEAELWSDDLNDDPPERPWLRRLMKIIYIVIILMVIAGLIIMFFPWDRVHIPFDPPFRFPERV